MGLGIKRPLCCFCWLFVLTCAIHLLYPNTLLFTIMSAVSVVVWLLLVALAVGLRKRANARRTIARVRYGALLALALVLGCLLGGVRPAMQHARTQVYVGHDEIIHATVLTRESSSTYRTEYDIMIDRIGEDAISVRAKLSCEFVAPLASGERVVCQVQLEEIDEPYELASGARLHATMDAADRLLSVQPMRWQERPLLALRLGAARLQSALSLRLRQSMGDEPGALCAALLLGDRSALSQDVTLQFRRSGVSHLLALSGMHLGILMAMVSWLLLRLRLPYRLRLMMVGVVALGYLILTGCAISTTRATVMLLWVLLSKRLGREADGLTSLSLFFAVCVAWQPTVLYDISLWLSSLAVAVPIAILPALQHHRESNRETEQRGGVPGVLARLWNKIGVPFAISMLCTLMLLLPMWMTFGEVSLLSPISTVLLTLPLTGILFLGLAYLLLLPLASWSVALFWLEYLSLGMQRLADWTLHATAYFGRLPGTLLSLRYVTLSVVMPLFGLVLVTVLLTRVRRRTVALTVSLALLLGCGCVVGEIVKGQDTLDMTYTASGKSEVLCVADREQIILCDFTDGSYRAYTQLLRKNLPIGHTEIDALVMTHYHGRHVSLLERLSGEIHLSRLYLPIGMGYEDTEKQEKDEGIARKLLAVADEKGIDVVFYEVAQALPLSDTLTLRGMQSAMIQRSAHPLLALSLLWRGELTLTYLGAAWSEEKQLSDFATACLPNSDVVILGGHGPLYKQEFAITDWSSKLRAMVVRSDTTGAFLKSNPQTQHAVASAAVYSANGEGEGDTVRLTLPLSRTDE